MSSLLALAGFMCTWVYSVTDIDPAPGLRVPLILLMPIGLVAATLCGLIARTGPGRRLAAVGLTLAAVALGAFILLLNVAG